MLAIKLRPIGKKKQRSFRIVVTQKHTKLVGKFVEDIGWYNPHTNQRVIKSERAQYWMTQGAQPTDTVHNIFVSEGVLQEKKRPVHARSKKAPAESGGQAEQGETKQHQVSQETKEEKSGEETQEEQPQESKEEVPEQKEEELKKEEA